MYSHQSLFDMPTPTSRPLARFSDTSTSHAGETHIRRNLRGAKAIFIQALAAIGTGTAAEIAVRAVQIDPKHMQETIRKRAAELVTENYIRVVRTRNCRVSGKLAQVYEVVN